MRARAPGQLLALVPGPAREPLRRAAKPSHWEVIELDRVEPESILEQCRSRAYLWLDPWTELSTSLVAEIDEWARQESSPAPRVARATFELVAGEVSIALGKRTVLASPGAARLSSDGPIAHRVASSAQLQARWRLVGPSSVSEHLRALNAETSCRARLARALDERPRWVGVALAPLWRTCRTWLGASGSRKRALSYAVLEGYRQAAATAKLWELANCSGEGSE